MQVIAFANLSNFLHPGNRLKREIERRHPSSEATQDGALDLRRRYTAERTRLLLLRLKSWTSAVTTPTPEQAAAGREMDTEPPLASPDTAETLA